MATKASTERPPVLVVKESFVGILGGAQVIYHRGDAVHPDDPAVRKWPHHFGPFVFAHQPAAPVLTTPEVRAD